MVRYLEYVAKKGEEERPTSTSKRFRVYKSTRSRRGDKYTKTAFFVKSEMMGKR
jgi:hypothetical protein